MSKQAKNQSQLNLGIRSVSKNKQQSQKGVKHIEQQFELDKINKQIKEDHYHRRIQSLNKLPTQLVRYQKIQNQHDGIINTMNNFMATNSFQSFNNNNNNLNNVNKTNNTNTTNLITTINHQEILNETNIKQQLDKQSFLSNKYYNSLTNIFENKLQKQKQSLDQMKQKIQENSIQKLQQEQNSSINMNMSQEQTIDLFNLTSFGNSNRRTVFEVDQKQTSQVLYPIMMNQVKSQKEDYKNIQQQILAKQYQLEQQIKALQKEDSKLNEFQDIQNQIETSYVLQNQELHEVNDLLQFQVLENQRLNMMITKLKSDIQIFYDRNEYQSRKIQIENSNIDDLNEIITQQFIKQEQNYFLIKQLKRQQNQRTSVSMKRTFLNSKFNDKENDTQKYLLFENKLLADQEQSYQKIFVQQKMEELNDVRNYYQNQLKEKDEQTELHQDLKNKINQIKSVAGKLNQNLSKEELGEFKNNFTKLLSYLENRKQDIEQSIKDHKEDIIFLQQKYQDVKFQKQIQIEIKLAETNQEFQFKLNSDLTKYDQQLAVENMKYNREIINAQALKNKILKIKNFFFGLIQKIKQILKGLQIQDEECRNIQRIIQDLENIEFDKAQFLDKLAIILQYYQKINKK